MTFKDLKKRICLSEVSQQSKILDRLRNKPFWIWNIEEHKQEDIRTNGDCCFNHVIGLPNKDGINKPLYDYEKMIFDCLTIPIGVTIIAILTIIGGILLLLSGIALVTLGAFFSVNPVDTTTSSSNIGAQFIAIISAAVGGVLLVIGIGYLVMFYGLLKGKGWAWTITIILLIIGIAIQIVSTSVGSVFTASSLNNASNATSGIIGSIIGIAINIAILYYLYRSHVKAYFGKAQQQPSTTV